MGEIINSLPWVVSTLLIVALSSTVYGFLVVFIRNRVDSTLLKKNHDVAGFAFSVVGIVYSVLLGFIVVSAQTRYDELGQTLNQEASILADLYRDSVSFPDPTRDEIRSRILEYVHYVVEQEWELLSKGKITAEMQNKATNIWNVFYSFTPATEKERIWYSESINKLNEFTSARLKRQLNFNHHIGRMMWLLLLSGAGITICFMFFFYVESLPIHILMIAGLSSYLNFMLYLVYCLDHVFQGPIAIKPEVFHHLLEVFQIWNQSLMP